MKNQTITIYDKFPRSSHCDHEFQEGLCEKCFCPETWEDTDRALEAVDNYFQHKTD